MKPSEPSKAICCFSHASWVELLTCCSTCFTDFPGCLTRVTLAIREQLLGWSRMEGSLLWAGCPLASPVLYTPLPFTPLLERKCSSISFTVSTAIFNAQWNIYPQAETQEDVQSQHKWKELRYKSEREAGWGSARNEGSGSPAQKQCRWTKAKLTTVYIYSCLICCTFSFSNVKL